MSVRFEGTGDAPIPISKDEEKRKIISLSDVKPEMEKGDAQFITKLQPTYFGDDFVQIFSTALTAPRLAEMYPRMQLEGRLYNRKGVIPMSLVQTEDVKKENRHQRSWIKDVLFRLSKAAHLAGDTSYIAQFYTKKSADEFPEMYGIKDKKIEYVREPDLDRLPPIRSLARGLVTRHEMDVKDGIRFYNPTSPSLSLWIAPNQRTDLAENQLYSRVDNQLQADCVDAVTRDIIAAAVYNKVNILPSLWGNANCDTVLLETSKEWLPTTEEQRKQNPTTADCVDAVTKDIIADAVSNKVDVLSSLWGNENYDTVLSETSKEELPITEEQRKPNPTTSFKKSFTKRCREFLRSIFGCTRRQTVEDH